MRSTRLIAVALLIAVGVAACGSSSKGASSSSSSPSTTVAASSSGSTSTAAAGEATTTTIKISSAGSGNFCALARSSQNAFSRNPTTFSAAALKQEYENLGPDLAKAEAAAPPAIKPDFATFIQAFTPYINALKAANYDFTKINFSSLTQLDSAAVKAASAHITAYFSQVCHITPVSAP
jgi:hypothetical protein